MILVYCELFDVNETGDNKKGPIYIGTGWFIICDHSFISRLAVISVL